jgi:hypothetical protein
VSALIAVLEEMFNFSGEVGVPIARYLMPALFSLRICTDATGWRTVVAWLFVPLGCATMAVSLCHAITQLKSRAGWRWSNAGMGSNHDIAIVRAADRATVLRRAQTDRIRCGGGIGNWAFWDIRIFASDVEISLPGTLLSLGVSIFSIHITYQDHDETAIRPRCESLSG